MAKMIPHFSHYRQQCSCGVVISQCRCFGPKTVQILDHPACGLNINTQVTVSHEYKEQSYLDFLEEQDTLLDIEAMAPIQKAESEIDPAPEEADASGGILSVQNQIEAVKPFGVILADCPWKFKDKMDKTRTLARLYPTLTVNELCDLEVDNTKISDLASTNSILALWATNAMLPEALKVMESWGFKYTTNFSWIKFRMGMGHTFRSSHELLLIGKKGKPKTNFKGQMSWGSFPVQDHSHKPEEVYVILERMFDGPYLELFARRPQNNWISWGNQLDVV